MRLVAVFKEQGAKIEARIDGLQAQVVALETRIVSLESWVKGVGGILIVMMGVMLGSTFFG